MENNKQNKSTGKTVLIVILLVVTIVALVLATYAWAKYTTTINGEASAQVAKWNISTTKGESLYSKTFEHVTAERIAPGTDGSVDATIDVSGTEVDVDYKMSIVSVTAEEGTIPTNLVLKDTDGTVIYKNKAIVGEGIIAEGRIATTDTTKTATKTLSWEWPFETGTTPEEKAENNVKDTADGEAAGKIKITYKIDAVQVEPTVK